MSNEERLAMERAVPSADELRVVEQLGVHSHNLRNGSKNDQAELVAGIATLIESQKLQYERIVKLPDRDEVRSMITAHSTQCAAARADNSSFSLGKGGIRATGRVAAIVAASLAIVFVIVAPHVKEWIDAWRAPSAAAGQAK